VTFTYKCKNESCDMYGEFDIDLALKNVPLRECPCCGQDVTRVYKSIGVSLSFDGSYNSTRKT